MKYRIQINMAEFGEPALWQDVVMPCFRTLEQAEADIEWMKKEYGGDIEYRIRTEFAYETVTKELA
jgi:hypothetical protein